MIPIQDRQLVYEFLMLDVAIRSLQYDIEDIKGLKYEELYATHLSAVLSHLKQDYQWRKNRLAGKKIRLSKWVKVDMYYSDAILATAGEDAAMRFSTPIKQNSQELISQKLIPAMPIEKKNYG